MKTCAEFSKDMDVQALAVFAATAFGDDTWVTAPKLSPFFAELQDTEPAQPPSGGVEMVVYTAMKDALDRRLAALAAQCPADPASTITARMDQYLKYETVSEQIARGSGIQNARSAIH